MGPHLRHPPCVTFLLVFGLSSHFFFQKENYIYKVLVGMYPPCAQKELCFSQSVCTEKPCYQSAGAAQWPVVRIRRPVVLPPGGGFGLDFQAFEATKTFEATKLLCVWGILFGGQGARSEVAGPEGKCGCDVIRHRQVTVCVKERRHQ